MTQHEQQEHGAHAAPASRRIYNPLQKDYVTFVETSAETNGERTLLRIELAPGGGNKPHYHNVFTERFEVAEGELLVLRGTERHVLQPGQSLTAPANTLHCFGNPTAQPTCFFVELRPGHTGFERTLQIGYGLAADGKTTKHGMPTNIYHVAVLVALSDSITPGIVARLTPVFRFLATRARKKGIEQQLLQTYCS